MRRLKKILLVLLAVALVCALAGVAGLYILDFLYPFPVKRIADRLATSSTLLSASDGRPLAWRVDSEENRRLRVDRDGISPWLVMATIAVEDKRFLSHCGIDPIAVGRAVLQNVTARRRVSGASTITMQTIRLLWPRPRRLDSKIIEAFRAWQLERLMDKDGILEIYFNLAPYGGNIIGAEAAARRYFGKSAQALNLAEACLLAGLPQSPARLNPLVHPQNALTRRNHVVQRLQEDGDITAVQALRVWREPLELNRRAEYLRAPHFSDYVLARVGAGKPLTTTLDAELQARVSSLAADHARTVLDGQAAGPAVVVLSLADSSVRAYVGNASPDGSPSPQVDAARSGRQPGSLLKPFIFALLAERGAISPSSRVYDLPRYWRDYAPQNMDREWRGALPAADALRESRNAPAVAQLERLGVDAFGGFMSNLGLEPARGDRHGLAMALGTKEQTLLALTNAYAALGRMGEWLPVRYLGDGAPPPGRGVLSPVASWLTLSALSPPEERREPRLVWKTGTSWNQLDAWAIAMTPETVVGVWCGRLERGGSGWVAGSMDALPLALSVLEAADMDRNRVWDPPAGVEFREVCQESGALPGWNCGEAVLSPMAVGNHARRFCQYHAPRKNTLASSDNSAVLQKGNRASRMRIVSPASGNEYVAKNGNALFLLAEGATGNTLTWFLNGRRLGQSPAREAFEWIPSLGRHRLSVSSDGEKATSDFEIRFVGDGNR